MKGHSSSKNNSDPQFYVGFLIMTSKSVVMRYLLVEYWWRPGHNFTTQHFPPSFEGEPFLHVRTFQINGL